MKRKAQSALEYMMTYGWAILIIVIVAAVLYSMGIFNPSSSTGTTATGFSPFTVLAQTCNGHGLQIQLGNNAGASVALTATPATVTTQTGMSGTGSLTLQGGAATITSGGSFILNGTTSVNCITSGARYSAAITIDYSETTGLGSESLQATGTVAGSAS